MKPSRIDFCTMQASLTDFCNRVSSTFVTDTYAQENARIWRRYYLSKPLYQPWASWEAWLAEYRALIVEVQEIYEDARQSVSVPS